MSRIDRFQAPGRPSLPGTPAKDHTAGAFEHVRDLVRFHRRLILALTLAGGLLGALVAVWQLHTAPVYRSAAWLGLPPTDPVRLAAGLAPGDAAFRHLRALGSRELAARAHAALILRHGPLLDQAGQNLPARIQRVLGAAFDRLNYGHHTAATEPDATIDAIRQAIEVDRIAETVLQISVTWTDPMIAADLANILAELLHQRDTARTAEAIAILRAERRVSLSELADELPADRTSAPGNASGGTRGDMPGDASLATRTARATQLANRLADLDSRLLTLRMHQSLSAGRLIDAARPPLYPERPRGLLYGAAGLGLGLLLALALVLVRDRIAGRAVSRADLVRATGAKVLAPMRRAPHRPEGPFLGWTALETLGSVLVLDWSDEARSEAIARRVIDAAPKGVSVGCGLLRHTRRPGYLSPDVAAVIITLSQDEVAMDDLAEEAANLRRLAPSAAIAVHYAERPMPMAGPVPGHRADQKPDPQAGKAPGVADGDTAPHRPARAVARLRAALPHPDAFGVWSRAGLAQRRFPQSQSYSQSKSRDQSAEQSPSQPQDQSQDQSAPMDPARTAPAEASPVEVAPTKTVPTGPGEAAEQATPSAGPKAGTTDIAPPDIGTAQTRSTNTGSTDTGPSDTGPSDTGPAEPGAASAANPGSQGQTPRRAP